MKTSSLTNPLSLPVEYRTGIQPLHEAYDSERLAVLTESMTEHGWRGAPVVADRGLAECNQDRAYTGSHRLAAWAVTHEDEPVPCVYIEDLCEALGIDLDALADEADYFYDAVTEVCALLPADVAEAYGMDAGG